MDWLRTLKVYVTANVSSQSPLTLDTDKMKSVPSTVLFMIQVASSWEALYCNPSPSQKHIVMNSSEVANSTRVDLAECESTLICVKANTHGKRKRTGPRERGEEEEEREEEEEEKKDEEEEAEEEAEEEEKEKAGDEEDEEDMFAGFDDASTFDSHIYEKA